MFRILFCHKIVKEKRTTKNQVNNPVSPSKQPLWSSHGMKKKKNMPILNKADTLLYMCEDECDNTHLC